MIISQFISIGLGQIVQIKICGNFRNEIISLVDPLTMWVFDLSS